MNITWPGGPCLRIGSRSATLVFEARDAGDAVGADILLYDRLQEGAADSMASPFRIDRPGEYEVHNAFVIAVQADGPADRDGQASSRLVYSIEIDGMSVCYLGGVASRLSKAQVEALGDVALLIVPLQQQGGPGPELAAQIVAQLEPGWVLPIGAGAETEPPHGPVAKFIDEIAAGAVEPTSELKLDPIRRPMETTLLRLLARA